MNLINERSSRRTTTNTQNEDDDDDEEESKSVSERKVKKGKRVFLVASSFILRYVVMRMRKV